MDSGVGPGGASLAAGAAYVMYEWWRPSMARGGHGGAQLSLRQLRRGGLQPDLQPNGAVRDGTQRSPADSLSCADTDSAGRYGPLRYAAGRTAAIL
jgi:hypothetical protein